MTNFASPSYLESEFSNPIQSMIPSMFSQSSDDVLISSSSELSWDQRFDNSLNYENLYINSPEYCDYQPTYLQFHLHSVEIHQYISVKIKYANRLTHTQLKYAIVCEYDVARKQWVKVNHKVNRIDHTIEFNTLRTGIYTVFLNHYWYSNLTQRLADEYPIWTKIRKSKDSNGQLFLNFFGIELETVRDYLEWISEQKYIHTADVTSLDWIYKYQLPKVTNTDDLVVNRRVGQQTKPVAIIDNLQDFFYNTRNDGGIIDYQEAYFYTTKAYGILQLTINKSSTHDIAPEDYHIWNAFDEFGLLLGVTRLHLENNDNYKERILDVFRYPSGTNDIGLINGIARDLNLIKRKDLNGTKMIWYDDSKDLLLKNKSGIEFDPRSIRVDHAPLDPEQYVIDEVGNVLILAMKTGQSHEISFVYGIYKHELHNKEDLDLYKLMYKEDGQATFKLIEWVEKINTIAPVMWGRFKWDEGFWDTIDKELTGLGYLPNIWDSNIDSWKNYTFKSDR